MANNLPIQYYFSHLHSVLAKYTAISRDETEEILPFFEVHKYEKKEFILHKGEVEIYLSIVVSGLIRKYFLLPNDYARTMQFATAGHLVQSENSFYHQVPSEFILQALESTILIRLHRDKMEEMFNVHPWTEIIGLRLATKMAEYKDLRYRKMIKDSSIDVRLRDYVSKHADMFQRVPEKILASYIGIQAETFSRKKQILFRTKSK